MASFRTSRVSQLQTKEKQLQDQNRKGNIKQKISSSRQKVERDVCFDGLQKGAVDTLD